MQSPGAGRAGQPLRREQLAILAILAVLTFAAWWLTLASMSSMAGMDGASSGAPGSGSGAVGGMSMPASPAQSSAVSPAMGAPPDGEAGMGGMAMNPAPASQDSMGGMAMSPAPTAPDGMAVAETATGAVTAAALLVFLGLWVVMMTAMMLPAAVPMILTFGTVYRRQRDRGGVFVPTWVFVGGYLLVWGAFGLVAWILGLAGQEAQGRYPQTADLASRLAAAAMIGAGLYQLTPLKFVCLQHCRSPLAFVLHHWRPGLAGAFRMGTDHGAYCVGCCWMLMVLLVAVGLASVPWMGAITLIILAEKVLPAGRAVTLAVAASLVGLGLLALAQPHLIAPA